MVIVVVVGDGVVVVAVMLIGVVGSNGCRGSIRDGDCGSTYVCIYAFVSVYVYVYFYIF